MATRFYLDTEREQAVDRARRVGRSGVRARGGRDNHLSVEDGPTVRALRIAAAAAGRVGTAHDPRLRDGPRRARAGR